MRVLLLAVYVAVASGAYLREAPAAGEQIQPHQVVGQLQDDVKQAATVLNEGKELESNEQKNVYNAILKGWGKPAMVEAGHRAVVFFLVSRTHISAMRPADEFDPAYGAALRAAIVAGVEALAYRLDFGDDAVSVGPRIPIQL